MATLDQQGNVLPDTQPLDQLDEVVVTAQRPRINWNGLFLALAGAVLAVVMDDLTKPTRRRRLR